jgi:hypothetical protein
MATSMVLAAATRLGQDRLAARGIVKQSYQVPVRYRSQKKLLAI